MMIERGADGGGEIVKDNEVLRDEQEMEVIITLRSEEVRGKIVF